ncbi:MULTISPECIES: polysaccharide deacetylase family protein [unclassified Modicisalibacter]|uniref:polysaccharide deacetylase family protein n=1 Tax=unclassified Modicisalibacter TaxID=2679913 RepID=UPI001CC998FE|nr:MULTISPECIES: polysaccharide deacetylase family protein [unclassified Modicisalibacter]MBZ9560030.1 polysaccharide deacetylase family protein [Modicisalibacter sp. R2A 31.J]MBZ9575939.1 polysaccharide deacetylase family protein [Modicisalibacter sp. MOD 31.J]
MSDALTIVMYHYVRPMPRSAFLTVKGRALDEFQGQLDFLARHYRVVRVEEVIAAMRGEATLPDNAALLTFDDGYTDHHRYVLPELVARGMQGSFFPPACSVLDGRVLDVNKIHFVLASGVAPSRLVSEIFAALDELRDAHDLKSNAEYYQAHSQESRYDTPEVTFIKRLLQKGLPLALRSEIVDRLFRRYVTRDERDFAAMLYMDREQLRDLREAGMCLGSHGDQHRWLNTLDADEQRREIDRSLAFLGELGVPERDWVMCYPYGGYDDSLLTLLREKRCALGLTVEVGVADIVRNDPLRLPRLDTNDVPVDASVPLETFGWAGVSPVGA